jgi:peroxiredoxin
MPTNLQDQLDAITQRTRELVPADRLSVSEKVVEDLFAAGVEDRIPAVGSVAPAFALRNANEHMVRSEDLLALGPLVVKFFRGRWCPYCVTEMEAWRDLYEEVRALGALLVGISPQTTRQSDFMTDQHGVQFPLLWDEGCTLAAQFGLAYEIPGEQRLDYREMLLTLPFVNGDEKWQLPIPATFVIGQDGKILFADAHADFRVRTEPEEVLRVLRGIAAGH